MSTTIKIWQKCNHSICDYMRFVIVATLVLGSRPRQRGCKGAGQEEARESHHRLPGVYESVREWALTLPRQLPLWEMESRNFRDRFEGSKLNGLWRSLYHWKALGTWMSKMGSHFSYEHLKHKLLPKEGPGVKLPIWLLTKKSRESTRFT